jgi:LysM repeat protein
MAARTPARFLAPIALVAFAFALYTVVQNARDNAGTSSSSSSSTPAQTTPAKSGSSAKSGKKSAKSHAKKAHRVRAGETPSSIALKYGVTVKQLEKLNPDMDPQALTVGERLRLRK